MSNLNQTLVIKHHVHWLCNTKHQQYPIQPTFSTVVFAKYLKYNRYEEFYLQCGCKDNENNALIWFNKLSRLQNWLPETYKRNKNNFCNLLADEFERVYRSAPLNAFQNFCLLYKICEKEKVPKTIIECKLLINSVYINIWDLMESKPICFKNSQDLQQYTLQTKRFFSLNPNRNYPLLRSLLLKFEK